MAGKGIRIRISHERLEALQELCTDMVAEFKPANEHQHLLQQYMQELHHKVRTMLKRKQEQYTLALNGAEPVAFYQLWNMLEIKDDKYATIIVGTLLKKLSLLAA